MSASAPDPPQPGRGRPDRAAAWVLGGIAVLLILATTISSRLTAGPGPPERRSPSKPPAIAAPVIPSIRPSTATPDVPIGPLDAPLPRAGVSLVADPARPAHLVAAINDYNAQQGMSVFLSDDGGHTWRQAPLPRIPQQWIGDPQLAYGPRGVLYLAGTGYDRDRASPGQPIDLAINLFRSDDGGVRWAWIGRPSGPPPRPPLGDDFPALAVDQHSGRITLAWTRLLAGAREAIAVASSRDGGRRFGPPVYLAAQPAEGATTLFDGAGAAIIAFMDLQHGAISVAVPDGRVVAAAPLREIPSPLPGLAFRVESYPHLARDPRSERLYLAWTSWEHGHAQVLLCSSLDGGRHWSRPMPVAADPAHDSFMPAIAVSPAGVLVLALLRRAGPAGTTYHEYLTTSPDCGRHFAPLRQVDAEAPVLGPRAPTYLGDYTALAVTAATAHAAWAGMRDVVPLVFTRAVPIPTTATC